jgi:hypothetical protein
VRIVQFFGQPFAGLSDQQEAVFFALTQNSWNELPQLAFYERIADSEVAHKAIVSSVAKLLAKGGNLFWSSIAANIAGHRQQVHRRARSAEEVSPSLAGYPYPGRRALQKRHHHAMGHRYQVGPPTDPKREPDFMKHDLDLVMLETGSQPKPKAKKHVHRMVAVSVRDPLDKQAARPGELLQQLAGCP